MSETLGYEHSDKYYHSRSNGRAGAQNTPKAEWMPGENQETYDEALAPWMMESSGLLGEYESMENENFRESPFLLVRGGEGAQEMEGGARVETAVPGGIWSESNGYESAPADQHEAPTNGSAEAWTAPTETGVRESQISEALSIGATFDDAAERDPYEAIRQALSPEYAHLSADELARLSGCSPALAALQQYLGGPGLSQVILALQLGKAGRSTFHVQGRELPTSSYLRLISRLCREVAEQQERVVDENREDPAIRATFEWEAQRHWPDGEQESEDGTAARLEAGYGDGLLEDHFAPLGSQTELMLDRFFERLEGYEAESLTEAEIDAPAFEQFGLFDDVGSWVKKTVKSVGRAVKSATHAIGDVSSWVKNAAKSAGRAVESATHAVGDLSSSIADTLGKVPVIGPGLKGLYGYTYGALIQAADNVVSGVRIDKIASRLFESQVQNVKDVAPYVQTIVSVVPGIGPGISGAISAGLTLAQGRPIDEALADAAAGALPGGALAKSMAKMAFAAASGQPLSDIAISGLPLSPGAREGLRAGLRIASDVAQGKRVDKVLLAEATRQIDRLPPELRTAAQVGVALGHGKKLQDIAIEQMPRLIAVGGPLAALGQKIASNSPIVQQARALVAKGQHGFDVAQGLLAHSGVPPHQLEMARSTFKGEALRGFDAAVAFHMGRVLSPPRPVKKDPPAKYAGYFIMKGIQGAPPAKIISVAKTVSVADANAKAGARVALKELIKKPEIRKAILHLPPVGQPYRAPRPSIPIAATCPYCGAPKLDVADSWPDHEDREESETMTNAPRISASVGRKGANRKADVLTVQRLINDHLPTPLRPLDVDGRCGPLTIAALEQIQRLRLGMDPPDGRVDPGGPTFRSLTEGGGVPQPPSPCPSPTPGPWTPNVAAPSNMRQAAWQYLLQFTKKHEGAVFNMYNNRSANSTTQDVTCGVGFRLDPREVVKCPWVKNMFFDPTTKQTPSDDQMLADWDAAAQLARTSTNLPQYCSVCRMRMYPDRVYDRMALILRDQKLPALLKGFPTDFKDFSKFPAAAQVFCVSFAYGRIPFDFPEMRAAIRDGRWADASKQCHLHGCSESKNRAHVELLVLAQEVVDQNLDPDTLPPL
jgi:hypothetical protein